MISPSIVGWGQTPYTRGDSAVPTDTLLAQAAHQALARAGVSRDAIDGLAVASFTLRPDRAIDLAVKLGIAPSWIMDSGLGGASGIDMLQHAAAAIRNGDAHSILVVAGDAFTSESFARLVREYNVSMVEDFAELPWFGPNVMFALLTQLQMQALGVTKEDYGRIVCEQRASARTNANAAFREPLTLGEYLEAPLVADPLSRFDCVPVVSGANAILLQSMPETHGQTPVMAVRAIAARHNHDLHGGDGLTTGLKEAAAALWKATGWSPIDVDVIAVYDDYPAMVVAQLVDAGFLSGENVGSELEELFARTRVNASGGQLSAGQCGAGGGLHFVIDAVEQLFTMPTGSKAFVSGYGMVANRYGACSNAGALERVS